MQSAWIPDSATDMFNLVSSKYFKGFKKYCFIVFSFSTSLLNLYNSSLSLMILFMREFGSFEFLKNLIPLWGQDEGSSEGYWGIGGIKAGMGVFLHIYGGMAIWMLNWLIGLFFCTRWLFFTILTISMLFFSIILIFFIVFSSTWISNLRYFISR